MSSLQNNMKERLERIARHFEWIESFLLHDGFQPEGEPTDRAEEGGLQFFLIRTQYIPIRAVSMAIILQEDGFFFVGISALACVFSVIDKPIATWEISEEELLSEAFKQRVQEALASAKDDALQLRP